MLAFIGDVEVVIGLWCIPLFIVMTYYFGWKSTLDYVNKEHYTESLFLIPAMALASTYPIVSFARKGMGWFARIGNNTPVAWWFTLVTIGPLLGSVLKETVAMTISAMLLSTYFYRFRPPPRLAYGTLALLFVNVSIGGTLTNFGNFSVTVVAHVWDWDTPFMFLTFGWKSLLAILINTTLYYFLFRKDFQSMTTDRIDHREADIPWWITSVHVLFLAWIIFNSTQPVIALGSFVLFLGFYHATAPHQTPMSLRAPIMVGFFFASLVIFGGLQIWWLQPIISRLNESSATLITLLLSGFTHNALINYLATKIPDLTEPMKVAIFSGTMIGGGLTILANGPNLVGYSLLRKHFNDEISTARLLASALLPTLIVYLCYSLC